MRIPSKSYLKDFCKINVLSKCSTSTRTTSIFIIPKKIGMVLFISDFGYINKYFFRRPCLILKIADFIEKLEGIHYVISWDLVMGYYTVYLDSD